MSILDFLFKQKLLSPVPEQSKPNILTNLLNRLDSSRIDPNTPPAWIGDIASASTTPLPSPTPSPVPQQAQNGVGRDEIERKIRSGFKEYGKGRKLPVEDHISQMVDATQRYDIFKKYPFLLPQLSILETSAGQNITRPNNLINWGARIQGKGLYSPESFEQSLEDAITAIANDRTSRPRGTARGRTASYYEPFRQSGDLKEFSNIYEPTNPDYYQNLISGIKFFEKQ